MSSVIEQTGSPVEQADGLRKANKFGAKAATASVAKQAPDEPKRHDAVGAEGDAFESILHLLMGLRDSDTLGEDFARQIARANRRAQANQRLTDDDLRVADAELRRGKTGPGGSQGSANGSAVAVERGEMGKGSLGYLYRPGGTENSRPSTVPTGGSAESEAKLVLWQKAHIRGEANDRSAPSRVDPRGADRVGVDLRSAAGGAHGNQPGMSAAQAAAGRGAGGIVGGGAVQPAGPKASANTSASADSIARANHSPTSPVKIQQAASPRPHGETPQEGGMNLRGDKRRLDVSGARSKAESGAPLPKSVQRKAVNDVQRVLMSNLGRRHSVVRLHLSPPELGRLTIDMRMDQDNLRITFKADNPQVGELLQNSASALSNALAEQGVLLERYEIILNQDESEAGDFDEQLGAHDGSDEAKPETAEQHAASSHSSEPAPDGDEAAQTAAADGVPEIDLRLDIKA